MMAEGAQGGRCWKAGITPKFKQGTCRAPFQVGTVMIDNFLAVAISYV